MSLPKLQAGQVVDNQFTIVSKLGEGAYGAVYKVKDPSDNLYALKIESTQLKNPVLTMDVFIMEKLGQNRHFCNVYGKGKTDEFNFVAMTLVSSSLLDLRKARTEQHFTLSTVIRAGMQCLEGIEAMHRIGFLHRDIKPGNYAIGRQDIKEQRLIYILDFGLCRKFLSEDGNRMRTPRANAAFRGTVRYAPLSCHRKAELAPKDDVETWFYQQIEMTKGMVPWKLETTMESVGEFKENILKAGHPTRLEMFTDVPEEYEPMFDYITSLDYFTMPDYSKILQPLTLIAQKNAITESQLYDWETPPVEPPVEVKEVPPAPSQAKTAQSMKSDYGRPQSARASSASVVAPAGGKAPGQQRMMSVGRKVARQPQAAKKTTTTAANRTTASKRRKNNRPPS